MINPQMMGPGAIPDIPPVKELWKKEKQEYRHWIIILGVGLIAIFALLLSGFIVNVMDKSNLLVLIRKSLESTNTQSWTNEQYVSATNAKFNQQYIIFPIVSLCLLVLGLITYGATVFRSYKEHNFAKLSAVPIYIIGGMAIWVFMQLVFSGINVAFDTAGQILVFVTNILFIVFYIFAAANVSKIRKLFITSANIEKLKKDPQYQAMQAQLRQMMSGMAAQQGVNNPYGPQNINPQPQSQAAAQGAAVGTASAEPIRPAEPKISPAEKKLRAMSTSELKEVAQKFHISGYEKMEKDELIKVILRVTNGK